MAIDNLLDSLINHPNYQNYYNQIQELETNREFCGHDMTHFLDVARLAYIYCLEDSSSVSRKDIYIVALLHDIGRHLQYTTGEPHEKASARLCEEILIDIGISSEKILVYQEAILNHRNSEIKDNKDLSGYIYKGDKSSRPCHSCPVEKQCTWPDSKKNLRINY